MAYEWVRFIWWLNQNAGAVQAMAAVVTVLLTGVLILATLRYVSLTGKLLAASEAASRATFMPDIGADIDFTHPRKAELQIAIRNVADPPIRIVRARFLGGTIFKWSETAAPPNEYASQLHLRPSEIGSLKSVFLRKDEKIVGTFTVGPESAAHTATLPTYIDYRISLHVGVIIEVSDIGGSNTFSFTILRNAHLANTHIAIRAPSVYETAKLLDFYPAPDLTIPSALV